MKCLKQLSCLFCCCLLAFGLLLPTLKTYNKVYAYNTDDYGYLTNYIGGGLVSFLEYDTGENDVYNSYYTISQTETFEFIFEANDTPTFVSVFKDALYIEDAAYGDNECYMFFRAGDNIGTFTIDISFSYLDRYGYHYFIKRETRNPLEDFYLLDYIIDNSTNYDGYHIVFGLEVNVTTTNTAQSSCQFVYEGALSSKTISTINNDVALLIGKAYERVTLLDNPTLWLKNAVSGFLDFEIMPELSLKHILYIVLAFGLLLAILKIWLGG